ncbi:competence protein ComG [Bacillus thuringiensis serovar argentinensis]|nr:competence protein ComG [Bacillus thuringiensis serovar argentinensis]
MAEMLVALSIVMMAVSLLLPQTVLVMQERKNIQIRYKAFVLLKREAALYMYENGAKRPQEKVVNGNVYYTYWGGNACPST